MPTLINNKVTYQGGEAVPAIGSPAYIAAQNGLIAPTPVSTTLNASTLGNTNPLGVPTIAPTAPIGTAVSAPIGTTVDANGNATIPPPPAPTAEAPKSTSQKIMDKFGLLGDTLATKGTVTQDLQAEQQLAQKTERATQDYNSYNKAKVDLAQQIENIYTRSGGTTAGAQAEASAVSRAGNANLANLAVQAQASQGLLSAAEKTIKDKLDAQFQPITDQIDYLTKFAQLNANDLTEKEKFQLQQQVDEKKAGLSSISKTADDLHQNMLQNGAPASLYSALDKITNDYVAGKITATDAQSKMYQAAGQYGVDRIKEAQITNINDQIKNRNLASGAQYDNDLDAMVGTVLSTISSKFGQQTFNQQIAKSRNDADKLNIVAAQVLKGQPAEFKRDFANQAVGIAQIDKAIAELDSSTETGVINNGLQYAYNVVGKDFDPKLAKINGYLTSAIQPYRNSVTGAAWGKQEDVEYEQLFGSTKYSPAELRQRLVQTKELLKSKSSEGLNAFVNPIGSYDNPFNKGTLSPTTAPVTSGALKSGVTFKVVN